MPRVASPSRLSVGSPSTRNRHPFADVIGGLGAVASALLADDEQQADARLAVAPQLLGRANLGGEDALRIARPAPIETVALDSAGKERRHAIEVGRQHDVDRSEGGEDVEASVVDRLRRDRVAEPAQVVDQPTPRLRFPAGRRVDVDQGAQSGLPDPRLELRARVGPRVAVFHDDRG